MIFRRIRTTLLLSLSLAIAGGAAQLADKASGAAGVMIALMVIFFVVGNMIFGSWRQEKLTVSGSLSGAMIFGSFSAQSLILHLRAGSYHSFLPVIPTWGIVVIVALASAVPMFWALDGLLKTFLSEYNR